MSRGGDAQAARFFQALGDPTRLALLEELRAGERNVTELVEALGCPQPKVSRHLKVLKDVGLVRDRREGRFVGYALSTSKAWPVGARQWLDALEPGLPLRERREAPARDAERTTSAVVAPPPTPRGEASEAPRAEPSSARPRRDVEAHLL